MSTKHNPGYWIGFDLGGTKMFASVFDKDFKCLATRKKKTKGFEGMKAGLERMQTVIRQACEEAGVNLKAIRGIGVGCPGPLDLEEGSIIEAPNLGWTNAPLKSFLQKSFDCPVVIANDVDVGVLGEYHIGAGAKSHCVLGVFPGTGIGAGCIYDGQIIRGKKRSAMEMGHIQVMPNGPLCGCGRHGCLEAVCSRLAISAEAAKAAYRGSAPWLLEHGGLDLSNIRSGVLRDAIKNGDHTVEEIVRDGARWLGIGIVSMIHLVCPDVIILGGGMVEAMPDLYIDEVSATVKRNVIPAYLNSYKIACATLGDSAAVTGAAMLVRDKVFNEH
ncbi:MAG: ROK family protein [Spartobacteria bacterium]|nr:ROK family protein [Spartobacteria bacterium]